MTHAAVFVKINCRLDIKRHAGFKNIKRGGVNAWPSIRICRGEADAMAKPMFELRAEAVFFQYTSRGLVNFLRMGPGPN